MEATLLTLLELDSTRKEQVGKKKRKRNSEALEPEEMTKLCICYERDVNVPSDLTRLSQLRELTLSGCTLTNNEFPISIFQLTALTILYVTNVVAVSHTLPNAFDALPHLGYLHMSNMGISTIPSSVVKCTNLQGIDMHNNAITAIPNNLHLLTRLSLLQLNENAIVDIPASIAKCISLRALYLNGNRIEHIPPEMAAMSNLTHLFVEENLLTPAEITPLAMCKSLSPYCRNLLSMPLNAPTSNKK